MHAHTRRSRLRQRVSITGRITEADSRKLQELHLLSLGSKPYTVLPLVTSDRVGLRYFKESLLRDPLVYQTHVSSSNDFGMFWMLWSCFLDSHVRQRNDYGKKKMYINLHILKISLKNYQDLHMKNFLCSRIMNFDRGKETGSKDERRMFTADSKNCLQLHPRKSMQGIGLLPCNVKKKKR